MKKFTPGTMVIFYENSYVSPHSFGRTRMQLLVGWRQIDPTTRPDGSIRTPASWHAVLLAGNYVRSVDWYEVSKYITFEEYLQGARVAMIPTNT